MALNTLRLNQRKLHPTPHIIFIKPLKDLPDTAIAEEYLYRIAAICHPILKAHHLSVTTLEEFPPNREFAGRNFNAGECIQLVLRRHRSSTSADGGGGGDGFLPFRAVVMVMMHELAHNAQMNHSKAFWAVRDAYADEMRGLWARGYTGEGMWGPGRLAASGIRVPGGREVDAAEMPEQLCGGTYRSRRGRKRKPKSKPDWREQKERRIAKKFGVNGQTLGEDHVERMALQGFKGPTTKSRVAGSKRARDLRAAAALARFEKGKAEQLKQEENENSSGGFGDDESDDDDYDNPDGDLEDAQDFDGSQLKDKNGIGLVRICEDEDSSDVHVKQEMNELQNLNDIPWYGDQICSPAQLSMKENDGKPTLPDPATQPSTVLSLSEPSLSGDSSQQKPGSQSTEDEENPVKASSGDTSPQVQCSACSMANESGSLLCAACSNVLDVRRAPGAWKCNSTVCVDSRYLNPADYGVCGVCGSRR